MRKVIYFLVFLLVPVFTALAENNPSEMDWEKVFADETMKGFWSNFFWALKIFIPFIALAVLIKFGFNKLENKIKKQRKK
jgi:Ni/Fe-hydrogenase subunit HybB-like protein